MKVVLQNAGPISVCGKCLLRVGHTRRTSAMLCGILEKPGEKSLRRNARIQLGNLQSEYKNKLQAYKLVEEAFARRLEQEMVTSDPSKYV